VPIVLPGVRGLSYTVQNFYNLRLLD
jgi:hypothetical protein